MGVAQLRKVMGVAQLRTCCGKGDGCQNVRAAGKVMGVGGYRASLDDSERLLFLDILLRSEIDFSKTCSEKKNTRAQERVRFPLHFMSCRLTSD